MGQISTKLLWEACGEIYKMSDLSHVDLLIEETSVKY